MDSQTHKALVKKRAAIKARTTHIKKYIDSLQDTVHVHDVNVRLQLLEKVCEEHNAVQDQLEYDDDDETQQHELVWNSTPATQRKTLPNFASSMNELQFTSTTTTYI
jgi:hypothetical protein